MITNLFVAKSFFMMGCSLEKCFGCLYCRREGLPTPDFLTPPGKINPKFRSMPVVINCFYGDPTLQPQRTKQCLEILTEDQHTGPVIIMTKGYLHPFMKSVVGFTKLDIHICLSTIGTYSVVDKISWRSFMSNVEIIKSYHDTIKFSCDFKPIMFGINSAKSVAKEVLSLCTSYNLPLCYCGLRTSDVQKKRWEGTELRAFPNSELSIQKHVSTEYKDTFLKLADDYKVTVFRKTSCLLSYVHGLEHDYNIHYWTRSKSECTCCIWKQKCNHIMQSTLADTSNISIPWNYELGPDGRLIIKEHLTSSDIRVLKWVTKREIEAPFDYQDYLSDCWYSSDFKRRAA